MYHQEVQRFIIIQIQILFIMVIKVSIQINFLITIQNLKLQELEHQINQLFITMVIIIINQIKLAIIIIIIAIQIILLHFKVFIQIILLFIMFNLIIQSIIQIHFQDLHLILFLILHLSHQK